MAVVLVVNDDRDMLDMYESVLQALGHQPITKLAIETGPETVRQVGATALLVDMEAPDEADFGLRIVQEVREDPELASLPIILATGATERVAPHRDLFDALQIPVLIKPFPIDALEETLGPCSWVGSYDVTLTGAGSHSGWPCSIQAAFSGSLGRAAIHPSEPTRRSARRLLDPLDSVAPTV